MNVSSAVYQQKDWSISFQMYFAFFEKDLYVTLTSASVAVLDIFLEISYLATFGEKALVSDLPFGAKLYRIFER